MIVGNLAEQLTLLISKVEACECMSQPFLIYLVGSLFYTIFIMADLLPSLHCMLSLKVQPPKIVT